MLVGEGDLNYEDLNKSKTCIFKKYSVLGKGNCNGENRKLLMEYRCDRKTKEYEVLEGECLIERYHNFMNECEELKQLTEGKVDLKEHQYNVKHCVLKEFWKRGRVLEFQDIDNIEDEWLRNNV